MDKVYGKRSNLRSQNIKNLLDKKSLKHGYSWCTIDLDVILCIGVEYELKQFSYNELDRRLIQNLPVHSKSFHKSFYTL
jgi:hypothetical protein